MGSKQSKPNSKRRSTNTSPQLKKRRFPFSLLGKNKSSKQERTKRRASCKRKSGEIKGKLDDLRVPAAPQVPSRTGSVTTLGVTENDYDEIAKQRIKKLLAKDREAFLLNQLLLSVQFYGNFERESYDAIDRNRRHENHKTEQLGKHQKTALLSDRVQDAIDRKVKYFARHGPLKENLLSLDTQTLYIVHDNIEISQPHETQLYSSLNDTPVYKLIMEDQNYQAEQKHKRISPHGYVKLRSVEFIASKPSITSVSDSSGIESDVNESGTSEKSVQQNLSSGDESFECESEYSLQAQHASTVGGKNKLRGNQKSTCYINGIAFSTGSVCSTSRGSSEYDYAYITAFNTHKPLKSFVTQSDEPLSTTILPSDCLTTVFRDDENESESEGYSTDNESDEDDKESTVKEEPQYELEMQQYLNSKAFLSYFINVFRSTIAKDIEITKEDLENATWKAAAIYVPPYEIMPAIYCPWPNAAFEWSVRPRNAVENPFTKQKFQWPTPNMISKVVSFGCHLIPVGYAPKTGSNPNRQLEWKIVFPMADRYLESCLSSAQIKVYMIMKAIFKTFVEPYLENGANMFTKEHLRTHLFWLCEENYAAWNEDCLGEKLLHFLRTLLHCIKTHNLPDYFLPNRNLFQNIPERNLIQIHRRLYRIYENPVNHLIIALRNLKYHKDFYPKMQYKKLYNFLTVKDALSILNPTLYDQHEEEVKKAEKAKLKEKPATRRLSVAAGSIGEFEKQEKRMKRIKRPARKVRIEAPPEVEKPKTPVLQRRDSIESIDVKLDLARHFEQSRQKLVLESFVRHFIDMSKYALMRNAVNTTQIYLKQAERLAQILLEHNEDAAQFLTEIEPILRQTERILRHNSLGGPNLPRRGSDVEPTPMRSRKVIKTPKEEYPYVNLKDAMKTGTIQEHQEEENDDDAKSTLRANTRQRMALPKVPERTYPVRAIIHSKLPDQEQTKEKFITPEEIIQNCIKRSGLPLEEKLP